ncbi:MAG: family 14 glycosylhydrolase [Armatimonadota bacterium]
MKIIAIALILAWCGSVVCKAAAPVASYTPAVHEGLDVVDNADGRYIRSVYNDRDSLSLTDGVTPLSSFLYFKLTDDVRRKIGSHCFVVVDFYNEGMMNAYLEYNSKTMLYNMSSSFLLTNTQKWDRVAIELDNAAFSGQQNNGADFRISGMPRGRISRVELYTEDPGVPKRNIADLLKKMKSNYDASSHGMFYTFGNDADEGVATLYKALGVTSVESYVTWETVEKKQKGSWDWSQWDKQVSALKAANMKWVPFLILGPAYSTPGWFRESREHYPSVCLEHNIASKVESLWNPNLPAYIERFISEFAKRYKDTGVIESVLLGIQGDFGEAIYPVSGGGWTFLIPGEYHDHAGFWCNDPYALKDFQKYIQKKYGSIKNLNKTWKTSYLSFKEVMFPAQNAQQISKLMSDAQSNQPGIRRRWLDFVEWYRASMTNWSEWWIKTTRKYFPTTPIYLCTGGDAPPEHGSQFAEQSRVAAKYKAGVRITNEGSYYPGNFSITRWVASACKQYGTYFGFEPAGEENEMGIVARIYNATTSGANQLHDYATNVTASQSRTAVQQQNLKWLFHVQKPVVPVALWYPNVHMTISRGGFLETAQKLRDYTDYDYVDETMLRHGGLNGHKILVMAHGSIIEQKDAELIAKWAAMGGRVIIKDVPTFESVEGDHKPDTLLRARARSVSGWDQLANALRDNLVKLSLPVVDLTADDLFNTQISPEKFLFYNMGLKDVVTKAIVHGKSYSLAVKAGSINELTVPVIDDINVKAKGAPK